MRQRRIKDLDEKLAVYSGGIHVNPKALKGRWQDIFDKEQPIFMELGCGKGQFIRKLAKAYPDRNFIAVEGNGSVLLRALQRTARKVMAEAGSEGICSDGVHAAPTKNNRAYTPPVEEIVPEGIFAVDTEKVRVRDGETFESVWRSSAADCLFKVAPNLVYAYMYVRSVDDVYEAGELSGIYLNFSDPWPKDRQAFRRLTHRGYLEGYRRALKPGACLEFKTDNEGLFRFSVEEFDACELEKLEYTEDLHGADCEFESRNFMTEYEEKFSGRGNPIYYCKVKY